MSADSSPKLRSGHSREALLNMQSVFQPALWLLWERALPAIGFVRIKKIAGGPAPTGSQDCRSSVASLPHRLEQTQSGGDRDIQTAQRTGHRDRHQIVTVLTSQAPQPLAFGAHDNRDG